MMEGIMDKRFNSSHHTVPKPSCSNLNSGERRWKRSVKRRYDDKRFDATRYTDAVYSNDNHDDTLDNDTRYNDTTYINTRYNDVSLFDLESLTGNFSIETRRSACSSDDDEKAYDGVERIHFDGIGIGFNHGKVRQNGFKAVDSSVIAEENLLSDMKRSTWNTNNCENMCDGVESSKLGGFEANLKLDKPGKNGCKTTDSDSHALIRLQGTPVAAEISQSYFQRSTSRDDRGKVYNYLERIPLDGVGPTFNFVKPERTGCEVGGSSDFYSFHKDPGARFDRERSWTFAQMSTSHKFEPFPDNIQVVGMNAQSRKRGSSPASREEDEDSLSSKEVWMLKKALKCERDAIQKLHKELEEERCASKTAADEAISMIMRIQEEKAAALMEAWQYRRVVEERECHNQEAIALLKEALLHKEYELLSLQDRMEAYQEMFMSIESRQGTVEDNSLEQGSGKNNLLLLEDQETSSSFSYEDGKHSNYHYGSQIMDNNMANEADLHAPLTQMLDLRCSHQITPDSRRLNPGCHFKDIRVFHDGMSYKYLSREDDVIQIEDLGESQQAEIGNIQIDDHPLSSEDMSVTILDRVKRLEERLEYIRHNQVLHHENSSHGVTPHEAEQEESERHDYYCTQKLSYTNKEWGSPLQIDPKGKCSIRGKSMNPSFDREFHKCFEILSPTRGTKNMGIQNQEECSLVYDTEADSAMKEVKSRGWGTDTSKSIDGDESGESIHDVYEVHEIKESIVHADDFLCRTIDKKHSSGVGNKILYDVQESASGDEILLQTHEGYGTEASKLSGEFSALNIHKSVGDEDVDELKQRLQALEGERVFMKEAIESLRKENRDLKLLQEIAQQLRELKGDVRRVEGSAMQCHLPFISFFKSLMSFAGIQNLSAIEEKRSFFHSFQRQPTISSTTQDGLLQILNKCSKVPRIGYVTREYKIKINT